MLEPTKRHRQLMETTAAPAAAHTAVSTASTWSAELLPLSVASAAPAVVPTALAKRSEISAEEKLRVLAWHHANGGNQRRTAAHFQATEARFRRLNQATVSRWLLAEQRFQALVRSNHASVIREKTVRHPEVEHTVALWLDRLPLAERAQLTGKDVKSMARRVYEHLQTPTAKQLELSNGWLSRFQARHGLKLYKPQGDAFASPKDLLASERRRLQRAISAFLTTEEERGVRTPPRSLADVWHVDETSFFFDCSPLVPQISASSASSAAVCGADEGQAAVVMTQRRLTLTLATNATGTERLEPLFVGREPQPRSFDGQSAQELGFQHYFSSQTAWLTTHDFSVWLHAWNQELVAAGRLVLLLLDPSWCHVTDLTGINNIQLVFLSPATSELIQPSCLGLSAAFHTLYRRLVVQRALERVLSQGSGATTAGSDDNLFEISQLEAMTLAKTAWQEVKAEAVVRSWCQAKVLPAEGGNNEADVGERTTPMDLQELQQALDALSNETVRRNQPLTLISAADFVRLELDDALGNNLSPAALVALARDAEKDNGGSNSGRKRKSRMVDDGAVSGDGEHGTDFEAPSPRSLSSSTSASTALSPSVSTSSSSDPVDPVEAVSPEEGLSALVMMEDYWRATGLELPVEMVELMQRTRVKLQRELGTPSYS